MVKCTVDEAANTCPICFEEIAEIVSDVLYRVNLKDVSIGIVTSVYPAG